MLRVPTAHILLFLLALVSRTAKAQWFHYPSPGIPQTPDSKPNLSAPAPRSPDGKPDLSGLWTNDAPAVQFQQMPLFELKPEDIILTPEGKALQRPRRENCFPGAQCLPRPEPIRMYVEAGQALVLSAVNLVSSHGG